MGKWRQRHFYNIWTSLTLFVTVVVLVLTVILYVSYKEHSVKILTASNEAFMQQVVHNAEQIDDHINSYAVSLLANLETMSILYEEEFGIRDILNDMGSVSRSLKSNPYIDSAYIYNGRSDKYYIFDTQDSLIRQGSFYDEDLINRMKQSPGMTYLTARKKTISQYDSGQIDMMTYMFKQFQSDGKSLRSALVLNIRPEVFMSGMVKSANHAEKLRHSFFIDRRGQVQIHETSSQFLTDLSGEPYIDKLLQSEALAGHFIDQVGGKSSIVTYVKADALGWIFVNVIPYDYILDEIKRVRQITVIIGLVALGVGLVTAFYISRQLYSPIRRISNQIKRQVSKQEGSSEERTNELEYIWDAFAETHNKYTRLKRFRSNHLHQLQQKFLSDALKGHIPPERMAESVAELALGIEPTEPLLLLLIRIDRYTAFYESYNQSERSLLKYAISNIALETYSRQYRSMATDMGEDHLVVFIYHDGHGDDETLIELSRNVQDYVNEYLQQSVSITIGETIRSMRELPYVYEETLLLSNYRMEYGHRCILTKSHERERATDLSVLQSDMVDNMLNALRDGKLEAANERLDSIIGALHNKEYDQMMLAIKFATASIFRTVGFIEQNKDIQFDLDFSSFEKQISKLETLKEIQSSFHDLFQSIVDQIHKSKDNRTQTIVEKTMAYIKQNYSNTELSAAQIADLQRLSSTYLNKLFRMHAGMPIAEYITQVRIEKARELLELGELTVDEIVREIGWENRKYFYTVFKKLCGLTPKEYRMKKSEQRIQE